jgi:hypothetical protein
VSSAQQKKLAKSTPEVADMNTVSQRKGRNINHNLD